MKSAKKHHKSLILSTEDPKVSQQKKITSKSIKKLSSAQIKASTNRLSQTQKYKHVDFNQIIEDKQAQLAMKTQKMYALIEIFNLIQTNNYPIRCMEHNNTLTLYCFTQRKILCANCTYGIGKHRTHKIVPLKDSSKFIKEDNDELASILRGDLKTLEESVKSSQQNRRILELTLKNSVQKIKEQYNKKFSELENKYVKAVSKVKQSFQIMISKSLKIEQKIEQFKLKIWQSLSKIGIGTYFQPVMNDTALIRQVISSRLVQLTRFQLQKMSPKQIQKLQCVPQL